MPSQIIALFPYVMANCDQSGGPDACWPWMGSRNRKGGYGRVKKILTHRIVWEHTRRRKIPATKRILHRCDNPPCCNPRHLFLGTQKNNVRDMVAKGRRSPTHGEANPRAKITEQQVIRIFLDSRSDASIHRLTGIPKATINHIRNKRTWAHVTSALRAPTRTN